MTGWRMGWLVLPASLADAMGKLIEFNTSMRQRVHQRCAGGAGLPQRDHAPRGGAFKTCHDTLVPVGRRARRAGGCGYGGMYAFSDSKGLTTP